MVVVHLLSGHLLPLILGHLLPPILGHLLPPILGHLLPLILGHLLSIHKKWKCSININIVDKEVIKVAEDNEGLVLDGSHRDDVVLDKEADVEVNQEVNKEVANVVDE